MPDQAERPAHPRPGAEALPWGAGCPVRIAEDGTVESGGRNLPGDREGGAFNLPDRIRAALPRVRGRSTVAAVHDDAVARGPSQAPWMRDVRHRAALTIGAGLGDASFTNRDRD